MRFILALPCLFVAVVLLGGCGAGSSGGQPSAAPDREEAARSDRVPGKARLACGRDGTRLLAPRVKARPDGVHLVIDNRFGEKVGYSYEYPEGGGGGDDAPEGVSSRVGDYPPGEVRIGCEKPPVDGVGTNYATLEVVDPEGFYKAAELECEGGRAVGGGPQYAPGVKGKEGDLAGIVRRGLSDRLREGDAVEVAGYPKSRERRIVRVVRDGRVVATVAFTAAPGGWLEDSSSNCAGF